MHDKSRLAGLVQFAEAHIAWALDAFADDGPEPAQYRTQPEWLSWEQALLYQVLENGVQEALGEVARKSFGPKESQEQIIRDAYAWIFGTQSEDLTSFEGLCRELNINPARIRQAITRKLAGQTRQPQEETEE